MELMVQQALLLAAWPAWIRPLWVVGLGMLAVLVAGALLAGLLRLTAPRMAAVVEVTAKEGLLQPLFWVLLAIGAFFLILSPFISYNTLGEDIKMLKDGGLTLIMLLAVIVAVWSASYSVSEEIEGRIAVTVLSKPIGRLEFVVSKFLGVLAPSALMFVLLGGLFLATVSYKTVYEARETSSPDPTAADCLQQIIETAPGLALGMMEVVVLAAIALAISTRLPLIPNLMICASIYALGHLMPTLVHVASQQQALPYFMAQLFAAVLPMLDYFSMYTAISASRPIPLDYLGWASLYSALYTSLALLLALLLFEDRDLA